MDFPLVRFLAGDGTDWFLPVRYVAEFAIGLDNNCAFCHGDPLAEWSLPLEPISLFLKRVKGAEYCPFCEGKPG